MNVEINNLNDVMCRCSLAINQFSESLIESFSKINLSEMGDLNTMAKFRTGLVPESNNGGAFWSCQDNTLHEVVILVTGNDMLSVDQYGIWDMKPNAVWCAIEEGDPGIELGLKKQFRGFVPCLVKNTEGKWEFKIWSMPKTPFTSIMDLHEMGTEILGMYVKVKRTGAGMKTKYTIVPQSKVWNEKQIVDALDGKEVPTPEEIAEMLGPDDRAGVIDFIEKRTGVKYSDILAGKKSADGVETEDL